MSLCGSHCGADEAGGIFGRCTGHGKKAGLAVAGFDGKHLYWHGETIDRFSEQYHVLVRRAYHARFEQDNLFRKALMEAKNKQLLHTIGNNDPKVTILTVDEFIGFLQELQEKL